MKVKTATWLECSQCSSPRDCTMTRRVECSQEPTHWVWVYARAAFSGLSVLPEPVRRWHNDLQAGASEVGKIQMRHILLQSPCLAPYSFN